MSETKNSTIKIFENVKFGTLRTTNIDGKTYFAGTDVASALGYSNSRDAIKKHCKEGGVAKRDTPTESGIQPLIFISEGNIYRLIAKSKLPAAEQFESWVFDEILPTLGRSGNYNVSATVPQTSDLPQRDLMQQQMELMAKTTENLMYIFKGVKDMMQDFTATRKEYNKQRQAERVEIRMQRERPEPVLLPQKVATAEAIIEEFLSNKEDNPRYTMGEMADELGFKSVSDLTNVLRKQGIIRWVVKAGCYAPAPAYANKLYLIVRTDKRYYFLSAVWTESGRQFLLDLKKKGELL